MRKQPTAEQKEKAAARRAAFHELAGKISKLTPEQRLEIAAKAPAIITIEGHPLSAFNQCLIASQREGVTVVGGFRQWLKAGRVVRKGEHGMMIWIPKAKKDDPNRQPGEMSSADDKQQFLCGTVFDVAQTDEYTPEAD